MSVDPNSPLKALYASKNDMPVLSYPNSLGSSRQGHFITFSVLIPTKSTYQETGIVSSKGADYISSGHFDALANIQKVANQASSAVSSVTDTIGAVAGVANKALSTANQLAGTAASVVGVVSGAKSIITGGFSAGSPLTALSGVVGGINGLSSIASTASSIPGVSSFLKDPMGSATSAFNSIKDFLNDPAKAFSSASSTQQGKDQTNGPVFKPSSVKPSGYINLYMPDTVSMSQHAAYNDLKMTDALGMTGGVAEGMKEAEGIKNSAASLYDSFKNQKNGLMSSDTIKTIKENDYKPLMLEGAGQAAGALGIVNDGAAVGKYLLSKAGYAINPQFEVVFSAMDMRTFQFDFTFTPKSPNEAETVREIIKLFRKHAAPNLYGGYEGRYFDVPSVFQIEYMHLEKRNENLHKFAPCVLTSIVVDYAPEVGWVTYNDGMPVKTRLTLMFKETEILTRDKIDQGY
jgi:hypothetical protein